MTEKIKGFILRHKDIVIYLIVGGLTTLVNYIVFYCPGISSLETILRNTLAWVAAVVFAFFANRKFVYRSERHGFGPVFLEFLSFTLARVFSYVLETGILKLCEIKEINVDIAKIPVGVLVVIVNYLTGLLVFRNRKKDKDDEKHI